MHEEAAFPHHPRVEALPPAVEAEAVADRPMVSVILPALNEETIVAGHLERIEAYLRSIEDEYRWEIIFVNDGSSDETGALAELFASDKDNVLVLHHPKNFGIGQAFKYAFRNARGDYLVTLDVDLTYSPDHIGRLVRKMRQTKAKVVIASPYTEGGRISAIPWHRQILSRTANRFLSLAARGNLSTLTGMVRAYDARFIRHLDLRSTGMDVNPEIIYKALVLHARIEEIPAHLDWSAISREAPTRRSSARLARHTMAVALSGFLFRPLMFFVIPGLALAAASGGLGLWIVAGSLDRMSQLARSGSWLDDVAVAFGTTYQQAPLPFFLGALALMLAIQLTSLGILALQNKANSEDLFHIATSIYRKPWETDR